MSYTWTVTQNKMRVASGSCADEGDANREMSHYFIQYMQDGGEVVGVVRLKRKVITGMRAKVTEAEA